MRSSILPYSAAVKICILPSLLAADVGKLGAAARMAEDSGGDALHIDIMDAHFVPNLSMGPSVVEMAKRCISIPLSVHLMMSRPDQYLIRFIEAGADSLLIHIEAECDVPKALRRIGELGARPGITLNPETPAELIDPVLSEVDEVLCMTVHPGYGGQSFIPDVLGKIQAVRRRADASGRDVDILVDGGINEQTIVDCSRHGANCFVAGTDLYGAPDMAAQVSLLRKRATKR